MQLHFSWIFLESHCQWSSCDSQEKLAYSSKENANSSLFALFAADSDKYLCILHSYFCFVFALFQLASGFLFSVWQYPNRSFFCILKCAGIRCRNPALLCKICTCFIHCIHLDTWGGWIPGILSLPKDNTKLCRFPCRTSASQPDDKGET